jgi:hypothetical protein
MSSVGEGGDQRVARLVEGRDLLLLLGEHHRLALDAHQHLVLGVLEVLHLDGLLAAAGGDQGCLVDQVGQVGTGETGGAAGQDLEVDVVVERDVATVHLQNAEPSEHVGPVDHHAPVEAAGPQQCRIEHVGPVGGGDEDHAFVGLEAVHLDE